MKALLIAFLKKQIQESIQKKFTVEAVKLLLAQALGWLKAKAEQTNTTLDDAAVKTLEFLLSDEALIFQFVALVQQIAGAHLTGDPLAAEAVAGPEGDLCAEIAPLFADWAKEKAGE